MESLDKDELLLFPEFESVPKFAPKMRLFMSIDQIGATKAKFGNGILPLKNIDENNKMDGLIPVWHNTLLSFHHSFHRKLETVLKAEYELYEGQPSFQIIGPKPIIWKRLGDEIVYVVDLEKGFDAIIVMIAMLLTIKKYRTDNYLLCENCKTVQCDNCTNTSKSTLKDFLNIKATFWMAGFPLVNMEISKADQYGHLAGNQPYDYTMTNQFSVAKVLQNNQELDFVGPSIDTGFRLTKKSDENRIALSFEVVYLLAKVFGNGNNELRDNYKQLIKQVYGAENIFEKIHFEGNISLKGVFKDKYNYPFFWLESPYSNYINNPNMRFYQPLNPIDLLEICDEFITEMGSDVLRPYIPGCQYLTLNERLYTDYIDSWNEFLKSQYDVAKGARDSQNELGSTSKDATIPPESPALNFIASL